MLYSHKPDISVKFSPRITRATKRLIDRICRRHDMFESDVLRFCLEAIAPEAAKRGIGWLTRQISGFDPHVRRPARGLVCMVTVRTSRRNRENVRALMKPNTRYTQMEVLRFLYGVILPIAYKDGFAKIMAMREKNL